MLKQNAIQDLNPKISLLGKYKTKSKSDIVLNHLLLLFKYFVSRNRVEIMLFSFAGFEKYLEIVQDIGQY